MKYARVDHNVDLKNEDEGASCVRIVFLDDVSTSRPLCPRVNGKSHVSEKLFLPRAFYPRQVFRI